MLRVDRLARLIVVLLAGVFVLASDDASAQELRQRIVSTSGVPHGDVANYRRSPFWREGMPIGLNPPWVEFLQTEIADITSDADVVLHQGDQVEGRWGEDCDGRGVFGPVATWRQRVRALRLAGNIYYSRMKRFWGDRDVLFAMGDHEIGDIGPSGITPPGTFAYRAHRYWATRFGADSHPWASTSFWPPSSTARPRTRGKG